MKDYEKLKEAAELVEKAHGCLLEAAAAAVERESRDHSYEFVNNLVVGNMDGYDCLTLGKLALEVLTLYCKLDEEIRK